MPPIMCASVQLLRIFNLIYPTIHIKTAPSFVDLLMRADWADPRLHLPKRDTYLNISLTCLSFKLTLSAVPLIQLYSNVP